LTPRERMLAAFRGERTDEVVWQPRLAHWYEVNKRRGTLPERYRDMDLLRIYDEIGATPRSYHYFNETIRCVQGGDVKIVSKQEGDLISTSYRTPRGELHEVVQVTEWGTASYHVEYPVKGVEDFEALRYLLENQTFEFHRELYEEMEAKVGERAVPTVTVPWLPLQRLSISYMGFERTILALWKCRAKVEELMQAIDQEIDRRLAVIRGSPICIVNFGDNIHHDLASPPLFRRYALPYYRRRVEEMHGAGKLCTSHWDGRVRRLLPYMKVTTLDGIECLTPEPMGDVTLEELHTALDAIVLIDGIPATHFLPLTTYEELRRFTLRLLDLFTPRLILGISDMMPPDGDLEKVRFISEIVETYGG